jgi:hypothetical protein
LADQMTKTAGLLDSFPINDSASHCKRLFGMVVAKDKM